MMTRLRQRNAKSTHGVPKGSFPSILLNLGGFGVTSGAQKKQNGAMLGLSLRPRWPPWLDQVQIRSFLGVMLGSTCGKKSMRKTTSKTYLEITENIRKRD